MNRDQLIARLKELEERIPPTLRWDWEYTNHYELTDHDRNPETEYWWLLPLEMPKDGFISETIPGQRLGWIIEYAVLSRQLREMAKHEQR